MFFEHGYDAVTIAEIAEAADVAVSTVFAHFPSKEAIAFARDPALEAGLVEAVSARPPGVLIAQALRVLFVDSPELVAGSAEFVALVRATPALTAFSDRMWSRHALALALAIERETGHDAGDIRVRAWTRYVVQIPSLVRDAADRADAVDAVFALLADGWTPEGPAP